MLICIKPGFGTFQPGQLIDPPSHQREWLKREGFAAELSDQAPGQAPAHDPARPLVKRGRKAKGL